MNLISPNLAFYFIGMTSSTGGTSTHDSDNNTVASNQEFTVKHEIYDI